MDKHTSHHKVLAQLDAYSGSKIPGLQYMVTDATRLLIEYAGGWADIENQREMKPNTTLMAYSMTKTLTAVAVLQLVEQGKLALDDLIDLYLPNTPYLGQSIIVRQLLDHTAGLPNPIPLRWVHLANSAEKFDEDAALEQVLRKNPRLKSEPGQNYSYSNIGYWLLGKIIERVSGQNYSDYVKVNILKRLKPSEPELDFVVRVPRNHAKGYLAKYSLMNLLKGFVTDRAVWGGYEGKWLRLESHYVNGPSFGGLLGTSMGFIHFLRDQLQDDSALFNVTTKRLLYTQQFDSNRRQIPMTLGWHVGTYDRASYFFKEGGGGGFHGEMRIYPEKRIASVVMANCTEFNSSRFLNRMDRTFLEA